MREWRGHVSRGTKPQQKETTKKSVYRSPHGPSEQGNKGFGTERNRKRNTGRSGLDDTIA
jgi:hypothetical protein